MTTQDYRNAATRLNGFSEWATKVNLKPIPSHIRGGVVSSCKNGRCGMRRAKIIHRNFRKNM